MSNPWYASIVNAFDGLQTALDALDIKVQVGEALKEFFFSTEEEQEIAIQEIRTALEDKMPIILQLVDTMDYLFNNDNLYTDLTSTQGLFSLELYGVEVELINLQPFQPYLPTVHTIIVCLAWTWFAISLYRRLPKIVGGI